MVAVVNAKVWQCKKYRHYATVFKQVGWKPCKFNKKTTTLILTDPSTFGCSSPDGGYKSIIDNRGKLLPKVGNYFKFIAQASDLNCFDINLNLTPHIGRVNRVSLTNNLIEELINQNSINGESLFSYAFVRSANRGENFSYTIM